MTFPSSIAITIGFNPETLAAVNGLAAAISGANGNQVAQTKPAVAATTPVKTTEKPADDKPKASEEDAVVYFGNHEAKSYATGTEADFKAAKAKDKKVVKLTETAYKTKLAELEAEKAKAAAVDDEEDDVKISEQDLIDAFGAYLDPNLDEDEKAERRAFVGPIVKRFGAKKASAIPEEHRKLALNLLARKVAGQDVDPETDEFEEIDEDGLV